MAGAEGESESAPAAAPEDPPTLASPADEDDSLSKMKSNASDAVSIMANWAAGDHNKSHMYVCDPTGDLWQAIGPLTAAEGGTGKAYGPYQVHARVHGKKVSPTATFAELGLGAGDVAEVLVAPLGLPDGVTVEQEDGAMTNFRRIEVELPPALDDHGNVVGHGRLLTVVIDWSQLERKKYLGGWRSRKDGLTYVNAVAQTTRVPKYTEADRKLSRMSQTVYTRTLRAQTTREAYAQCARPNMVIAEEEDVFITPYEFGPYQEAWELRLIWIEKAIVIKRYWRGWVARQYVNWLRSEKRREEIAEMDAQEAALRAAEEQRERDILRRVQPRTAEDFAILHEELAAWHLNQTSVILEESKGDMGLAHERKEELLYKETKLLQTIDRLKLVAQEVAKEEKIDASLRRMSNPKKWGLSTGDNVEVHTPFTIRARELMHLYHALTRPSPPTAYRLDMLLHTKYTVKEFDCALTRELVQLLDREADLLNRGRPARTLDGLRRRIANLFASFVHTPEFNPEAGRLESSEAATVYAGTVSKNEDGTVRPLAIQKGTQSVEYAARGTMAS